MKEYKLVIFDIDGTIADRGKNELYPDVIEGINQLPHNCKVAFASNAGGVGFGLWAKERNLEGWEKYPTQEEIESRANKLAFEIETLTGRPVNVLLAFQYRLKNGDYTQPYDIIKDRKEIKNEWLYVSRKPGCGMIFNAQFQAGLRPLKETLEDMLMVGDRAEDMLSARSAKVKFQWAFEFFNRPEPEKHREFLKEVMVAIAENMKKDKLLLNNSQIGELVKSKLRNEIADADRDIKMLKEQLATFV